MKHIWRRLVPAVVVSIFYFGFLIYPVLRIWHLLLPPAGTLALLCIMVGPVALRLAAERFPGRTRRLLATISLTWLGVYFVAFTVVLPWELIHLAIPLDNSTWGVALLVTVSVIAGYALWSAQSPAVEIINVNVPDSVPADVRGTSIAQITDLHVGSRRGGFLRRVVNRLNRLDADYVMITGDLVDFNGISSAELAPLADLSAPAYFCIGNHERYDDLEDICTRLDGHGVTVLRNRSVLTGGLQFVGVDDADARSQVRTTLATLTAAPGTYRVLLYHRPDGAEDAADWGAHLMLCGHTHNGQMFPFNYLVRRMYPRIRGRFEIGDMTLYVSRGTGTWGPVMRLGSRPEISMIQLH